MFCASFFNVVEFLKLSSVKIAIAFVVLASVCACSILDPFIDRRRNAGERNPDLLYVGESKPDAPAICYNILTTDLATLQKMADEECIRQRTGTRAEIVKQTIFTCRLLLPNHLYFRCVP